MSRIAIAGLFGYYNILRAASDVGAGAASSDTEEATVHVDGEDVGTASQEPQPDPASEINLDVGHAFTRNMEAVFRFKKEKNELGERRPDVKLILPVPTLEGLAAALRDENQREFILDLLADVVREAARDQITDETRPVNKQEELNVKKLTLEYLANQPKAVRTGGGISKEVWEAFAKDYTDVMQAATGKSQDAVTNAAKLFVAKFNPVKTQKKVITFLRDQLAVYTSATPNLDDFADCVAFLDKKAEDLLNMNEEALLENL
jgi:hypothetical protein